MAKRRDRGPSLMFMFLFVFWWMSGIVFAKGFWSTLIAAVFFPYSFYVAVEVFYQWARTAPGLCI